MSGEFKLDTRKFEEMLDEMDRKIKGASFDDILRGEVSAVLKSAASRTKKAKKKEIRSRIESQIPKKTSSGWYQPEPGKYRKRAWRVKSEEWSRYQRYLKTKIAEAQRRAGLAAQTWVDIGEQLKIAVKAPKFVKNATVNGRKYNHNARGIRSTKGPKQVSYTLIYSNPVGRWASARNALKSAVNGRTSFFRRNVRAGVFDSARQIAAKYPGIKIKK